MSFTFSRALVEEFSRGTSLDADASAPSSSTPTPDQSWWPDKTTEHSRLSRFGMTCGPLTADRGAALLTWWLGAFRAKTSPLPGGATDSTESAQVYGQSSRASFAKFSLSESRWRTHQLSLAGDLAEFLETWPRWGSMRSGECWERTTVAGGTAESESGLLPTPRASDGMKHPLRPAEVIRRAKRGHAGRLEDWVALAEDVQPGQRVFLSPAWLESLMGWPIGWTALTPLGTGSFREWQQQHGKC